MATRIEPLMTVADLDAMPDDGHRYEVIEGELFMSRAPGLPHQLVSGNLFGFLWNFLVKNPIGIVVTTPGVIFSELTGVIPDIIFMSHERRDDIVSGERLSGAPELMIEILSPGSENSRRDKVAKRQLYGRYDVNEYWIVDPENRAVEVYRLKGHLLDFVDILTNSDELTSPLLPGFACTVADIFKI